VDEERGRKRERGSGGGGRVGRVREMCKIKFGGESS